MTSSGQVVGRTHPAERTYRSSSGPSSDNNTVWAASKEYPYAQTVEEGAMRNVPGITMFESAEIDDLQSCFDTIFKRRGVARSSMRPKLSQEHLSLPTSAASSIATN